MAAGMLSVNCISIIVILYSHACHHHEDPLILDETEPVQPSTPLLSPGSPCPKHKVQLTDPGMQVVVVDEIGSPEEVRAVKSIAQRGVMLVGTAHGVSLSSLIEYPELNNLVGGVHQVVVGDRLAE